MKTIFIINPYAGQGTTVDALIQKIKKLQTKDKEFYITKAVNDATQYVRNYCENHGVARFIACGGDGTVNEVLNGLIGFDGAELGVLPIGTGNDFCRNFDALLSDGSVKCDVIKYTTETADGTVTGYCANMFNIGFDCNVADLTSVIKKKPFISGSLAYFISIFVMLIRKKGANLKIEIDGKERHFGKLLLTSIANGQYCGGGIKSNPLASVCDGSININIVKNVSRLKFVSLLPYYMKGTHMNVKNIDKVLSTENCTNITITPLDGKMRLCVDGEIIDAGKTSFEVCPGAVSFVSWDALDKTKIEQF